MSLPQVVIDTNVIVAGLRSRRGSSFQLLSLIGTGQFDIHLSVPLVLEYTEFLRLIGKLP
jgi:predicted nucleic acid-binding protein